VQSATGESSGSANSAGAREASEMLHVLERFSQEQDGKGPLAETCYLAVEGIKRKGAKRVCACQYASHDPAIGDPNAGPEDIERYRNVLESVTTDLFERYVAMFTLRNLGACDALAAVLDSDQSSCVLRHELAFVLGQMENDVAVAALTLNLGTASEHVMVRHEAAIALGSIGGETAKGKLREYANDAEPMVAESCQVALDTAAYWEAWDAPMGGAREHESHSQLPWLVLAATAVPSLLFGAWTLGFAAMGGGGRDHFSQWRWADGMWRRAGDYLPLDGTAPEAGGLEMEEGLTERSLRCSRSARELMPCE